jgi:hypothetical protein
MLFIRLTVYTNKKCQEALNKFIFLLAFNNFIELKVIEANEDFILHEFEHTQYNDDCNKGSINLRKLIDDRKLNNYDKNIKFCNRKSAASTQNKSKLLLKAFILFFKSKMRKTFLNI